MQNHYDIKKEWEKTKKMLVKFGKEATSIAKKGEEEIVKFSHKSKLQIDVTTVHLKIEKLYYQIGKEYAKVTSATHATGQLTKLMNELKTANKKEKALKSKIKKNAPKKKAETKKIKTVSKN